MTRSAAIRASSAEAFAFHGDLVEVHLRDGPVVLTVAPDQQEHARRSAVGLGAITDRELLTALWELPAGYRVSASALPQWTLDRLHGIPAGVVEELDDSVIRAARPPVRITGALAIGRRFDRILTRVGQVSALAPMAVVVDRAVESTHSGVLDAQLYGVGVGVARGVGVTPMLAAAPVIPTPGPFQWWVSELAYKQLVDSLSRRQPTP